MAFNVRRLWDLGWRGRAVLLAFFLALTITGWFGTRVVRHAIFWHYHTDDPLRPWMNVPFIAHSYRVPPYVLYQALDLPPTSPDRRPIREIAEAQNRSVDEVIAILQDAIVHARPPFPPPPPPPPGNGRAP